ncbi:FIMAH domain-containing protein [Methanosarcina mazei]|uniref:PEF-CTERM sorting domain-containing protein n=1 Tax=Methanosarcina mazei TaxID=2209 RepID=A0A0F8EL30_METMZ|nr:hypothetical protein [Methanosarcina mazei]KKG30874.1 hypothetical protein DU30_13755 [Methanosarcina mazei]
MRGVEKQRKHVLTRVLGIVVLLLLILVSVASAEQTVIDSITTDPERPIYVDHGSVMYADFTVTVNIINPPAGGYLGADVGCGPTDIVLIDDNGMATFEGHIQIAYDRDDMFVYHECPASITIHVYDAQGNFVAYAEKYIRTMMLYNINPIITWNVPEVISYGTPLSSTQLNAVALNPLNGNSISGTFVYTPVEGTVLSEGTHTLHVEFIPDDTVNYKTASKDVTIEVYDPVPPITWNNPADITYGTALSSTQLNAVSQWEWVDGTFVYTPVEGTVLSEGTHTLHVEFIPDDTETYTTASKDVTINVLTHVQEIQQITAEVQSLNLAPEEANLLIVKLDTATKNLNKGNTLGAATELNAFTNQVNAYINNGKISLSEGQVLIDDTNDLIKAMDNVFNFPAKSVPEFPSIALPMISVVGLLLLSGRKRNS